MLRLDLERIRLNLEKSAGKPQTHEDALRLIGAMGVRLKDDEWFSANDLTARAFTDDEVLERREIAT